MIPFAERYGLKLAEKQLSKMSEFKKMNITHLGQIEEFKELTNVKGFKKLSALKKIYLNKSFDEKYVSKVKAAKEAEKTGKMSESDRKMLNADKALHLAYGGVDASSFIASILGLTILAPKVGHEILHPIMHAIGMNKKEGNDVGTPNELYLADAKIPTEKKEKINVNA